MIVCKMTSATPRHAHISEPFRIVNDMYQMLSNCQLTTNYNGQSILLINTKWSRKIITPTMQIDMYAQTMYIQLLQRIPGIAPCLTYQLTTRDKDITLAHHAVFLEILNTLSQIYSSLCIMCHVVQ